MAKVLLITGPAGSGKTTISRIFAERFGWSRVAEDDVWPALFGKNRGTIGSDEHRRKRAEVHEQVFAQLLAARRGGRDVVIEATVHESPPESFAEYRDFFSAHGIEWYLRVLYPRVEVAVARDATRHSWHLGAESVAELHAKFTGTLFPIETYMDNSDESAEMTAARVLASLGFTTQA